MLDGPLTGIKVIDLTEGVAGPYCTKLFADFGAEVIKVERPDTGDWTRHRGPFFKNRPGLENSLLFAYLNTNKRSVTLNLDTSFGQDVVRTLAKSSNVMVSGFPERHLRTRGLDARQLRKENERLVITFIPLFDPEGPFANYKAVELNLYAASGLMSLVGGLGRPPLKAGGYQAQYMAGLQACAFTLFATYKAQTGRKGSIIDTSVMETCTKVLDHTGDYTEEGSIFNSPEERRERGNSVLPCKDGYVTVTLYYFQMKELAELLGKPCIATDSRFASEASLRGENMELLRDEVKMWLKDKTADEAQEEGQKRHLLFTKVNTTRDLLQSPHFRARNFFQEVEHPVIGRAEYPGASFRLSGSPAVKTRAAPILGEANEFLLRELLGYAPSDLERLRTVGAI
jgi:crotonobetainyl-CoA:carnitine CoA-transferase CaiB-like acyl-CoA transferase